MLDQLIVILNVLSIIIQFVDLTKKITNVTIVGSDLVVSICNRRVLFFNQFDSFINDLNSIMNFIILYRKLFKSILVLGLLLYSFIVDLFFEALRIVTGKLSN